MTKVRAFLALCRFRKRLGVSLQGRLHASYSAHEREEEKE